MRIRKKDQTTQGISEVAVEDGGDVKRTNGMSNQWHPAVWLTDIRDVSQGSGTAHVSAR